MEQTIGDSAITASFDISYQPGILIAKSYDDGKETNEGDLVTAYKPVAKVNTNRNTIKANPNNLSYINVEIAHSKGNFVPSFDAIEFA